MSVLGLTIYGLQNKVGLTVTANIAGLDCGTYTVASDGSIFVPWQSDPDQALTQTYLQTISNAAPTQGWGPSATKFDVVINAVTVRVTVPCSVGFPYTSQGQKLRPDQQGDAKSQQGPALGVNRRAYQFAALVAVGVNDDLSFGTDFNHLHKVSFPTVENGSTALDHKTIFSGVYWSQIDDTYSFDSMVCWQTSAPQPLILSAVGSFIETNER